MRTKTPLFVLALAFLSLHGHAQTRTLTLPRTTGTSTGNGAIVVDSGGGMIHSGSLGTTAATLTFTAPDTCWNTRANAWVSCGSLRPRKGPAPTIAQVRNASHRIQPAQLAPASYIALAKSVGARASAQEAEMLATIGALDLPVYEFAKVDHYLANLAEKQGAGAYWVWKPVSEKTQQRLGEFVVRHEDRVGTVSKALYGQSIPAAVLATMAKVMDAMPDAILLASDYEVAKPDPFLAVTTPDLLEAGKIWIVAQWDEPGFGKELSGEVLSARR